MANYANLKAQIDANIFQNDSQAITGAIMNAQLKAMVDALGAGYQFVGVATPSTNPGSPDQKVFYLASQAGTYTNFLDSSSNALVVNDGEVCVFVYSTSWSKRVTGAATSAKVSQLEQMVDEKIDHSILDVYDGISERSIQSPLFELGRITSTGAEEIDAKYIRYSQLIPIAGGKCATVNAKCVSSTLSAIIGTISKVNCAVSFYDRNGDFLSNSDVISVNDVFADFAAPSGTAFIRLSFHPLNGSTEIVLTSYLSSINNNRNAIFITNSSATGLAGLQSQINSVEASLSERIEEVNVQTLSSAPFPNVGFINSSGAVNPGDLYRHSDYLPVCVNSQVTGFYNRLVSFFDEEKNFISQLNGTDTSTHIDTITLTDSNIPDGAVFFIASTRKTDLADSSIKIPVNVYAQFIDSILAKEVEDLQEAISPEQVHQSYSSDKSRITIYIDDVPDKNQYYINVRTNRTDIVKYTLYKSDLAHSSREVIKQGIYFGQEFLVEKDPEKPCLYLYSGVPAQTFQNPFTYNVTFTEKKDTIVGNITDINKETQSWKGKQIVIFGDSITEFSWDFPGYGEMRYSDWIKEITGANIINLGIGGTRICPRNPVVPVFDESESYNIGDRVFYGSAGNVEMYEFINNHSGAWNAGDVMGCQYDAHWSYSNLDFYNLVAACCDTETPVESRFDNQIAAADYISTHSSDDNNAIVALLPGIDWSGVDSVIIMGGNNDWGSSLPGAESDSDATTLRGAINAIINKLLTAYQHIKLYWFTPPVDWEGYAVGQPLPPISEFSDTKVKGSGEKAKTLKEIAAIIASQVSINHIPVGDLYNQIGWNVYNFSYYFNKTDGTHPGRGYEQIARYMISKIKSYQTFR